MDKIEKIRKAIERRKGYISVTHFAEELLSFLDTLSEEPDKSLEKAAVNFAHFYDQGTCDGIAKDCFIAGARWQKQKVFEDGLDAVKRENSTVIERTIAGVFVKYGMDKQREEMMKEAVDVTVMASKCGDKYQQLLITDWNSSDGLHNGDKVRIIIVRED